LTAFRRAANRPVGDEIVEISWTRKIREKEKIKGQRKEEMGWYI
jgi:hypothetical protein